MPSNPKLVFAGQTPEGERIALYVEGPSEVDFILSRPSKRLPPRDDYFIKLPNGETWALSHESTITTWDEEDLTWGGTIINVKVESPVWTGTAKGTREDFLREEGFGK